MSLESDSQLPISRLASDYESLLRETIILLTKELKEVERKGKEFERELEQALKHIRSKRASLRASTLSGETEKLLHELADSPPDETRERGKQIQQLEGDIFYSTKRLLEFLTSPRFRTQGPVSITDDQIRSPDALIEQFTREAGDDLATEQAEIRKKIEAKEDELKEMPDKKKSAEEETRKHFRGVIGEVLTPTIGHGIDTVGREIGGGEGSLGMVRSALIGERVAKESAAKSDTEVRRLRGQISDLQAQLEALKTISARRRVQKLIDLLSELHLSKDTVIRILGNVLPEKILNIMAQLILWRYSATPLITPHEDHAQRWFKDSPLEVLTKILFSPQGIPELDEVLIPHKLTPEEEILDIVRDAKKHVLENGGLIKFLRYHMSPERFASLMKKIHEAHPSRFSSPDGKIQLSAMAGAHDLVEIIATVLFPDAGNLQSILNTRLKDSKV